jgi:hypothetical protein
MGAGDIRQEASRLSMNRWFPFHCSGNTPGTVPRFPMVPGFLASISPARLRLLLRLLGVVILLAGYAGAALVWRAQDRIDQANAAVQSQTNDGPLSTLDSRSATRQVELNYGKMGLLMVRWTEWAESLTHGRPLAETMVVLSSVAAIACFLIAGRGRI